MSNWKDCKNILCVRLDNMGDLLMSAPAITCLKESFGCKITVLTSSMAAGVAAYIPAIDEIMIFDVPWVKTSAALDQEAFIKTAEAIKARQFDGAIIFTVFSQNPLAAFLISWMAQIPLRAGYCRENPYHLLTDWLPDPEPYSTIQHQVKRDLDLVKFVGARAFERGIPLRIESERLPELHYKMSLLGIDLGKPWIVLHPGVSEAKRSFPTQLWIQLGRRIIGDLQHQVIVTGSANELALTNEIADGIGAKAFSTSGQLSLAEFILLIHQSPLVISVNTGTVHIAAGTHTKTIVLYALTNPQHAPWKCIGKVLPYSINERSQSKNEVLKYVQSKYFDEYHPLPTTQQIITAAVDLITDMKSNIIPEIIGITTVAKV